MCSDIFQETEVTSASTYEAASGEWDLQVVHFTISLILRKFIYYCQVTLICPSLTRAQKAVKYVDLQLHHFLRMLTSLRQTSKRKILNFTSISRCSPLSSKYELERMLLQVQIFDSLMRKCYHNLSHYLTITNDCQNVFLIYIFRFIPKFSIVIGGIVNREYKFRILIVNTNYHFILEETVINEI